MDIFLEEDGNVSSKLTKDSVWWVWFTGALASSKWEGERTQVLSDASLSSILGATRYLGRMSDCQRFS